VSDADETRRLIEQRKAAAERQIRTAIGHIEAILSDVERCLENGRPLNGLGELQSASAIFESGVGAYSCACTLLRDMDGGLRK